MILALFAGLAQAASTPPVAHVLSDPLLPQKYRSVPPGVYPCSVLIDVSAEGKVTDVKPVECDEEAFWALATAIISWDFDPATTDGAPVAGQLPYTAEFEVKTLLPRKHIVGFVGAVASVGGAGFAGAEGRIHLGEQISVSAGVTMDLDTLEGSGPADVHLFVHDAPLAARLAETPAGADPAVDRLRDRAKLAAPSHTDVRVARRAWRVGTLLVLAIAVLPLVAGVFVVTPDSVSVIGLADDTRNSIDPSPQATEIRLRSESLEPTQAVVDELTLSSLSVQSTAAAVSAGLLWWLVNGGTLLWIVLTYGPLARTFDPLPILARERRDDEDDDGLLDRQDPLDVPTLFDDPNAPSPAHTPVPDNISRQPAAIVESA